MKSRLFKKIAAGAVTLAMAAQFAFVLPASADGNTYSDQTVDLSTFSGSGTATTADGVTSVNVTPGSKGAFMKVDLKSYTQHGEEQTMKVIVSYKETVSSEGRSCIGFYDDDVAQYQGLGYQDISGAFIGYGVMASNTEKRLYLNQGASGGKGATFSVDAEESVSLTIDLENQKISGSVGAHTIKETAFSGIDSVDAFVVGSWSTMTYKVSDMKITTITSTDKYYKVTFNSEGNEVSSSNVKEGESVTTVPTVSKTGYTFDGWLKDGDSEEKLYTADEIKAMTITATTTFTAQFTKDDTYIEKISSVTFTDKKDGAITQPAENTTDSYTYTVKVLSEIGTDLTEQCSYEWKIVGSTDFDGYASLVSNGKSATLNVSNGVSNYYGYIEVTATYDPDNSDDETKNTTGTAHAQYAILGNAVGTDIIPAAGYPADMSDYDDSLVGYMAPLGTSQSYKDLVLNNWNIYGSLGTRSLSLIKNDDGSKALKFSNQGGSGTGGSSVMGLYNWTAQTSQYIIDTIIKLPNGASMGMWEQTSNNTGAKSNWVVSRSGDTLTVGSESISGVTGDDYFRLIVSCDPSTNQYYVRVFDEDKTNLIGETIVQDTNNATEKYIALEGAWPIEVKYIRAYKPTAQTLVIQSDDAIKVPETGEDDVVVTLGTVCTDADGNKILSNAAWTLEDEYANVELDENTGELTVKEGAAGTITVRATVGSVSATKDIILTTSSNVVEIKGSSSITIPFSGEAAVEATYTARTIDKDQQPVENDTITYSFIQKDGVTPLTTMPKGISFDEDTGKLTVEAGANPTVMYIKATNSEGLANRIKINIHGMSFVFGSDEPEEGYTQVTAADTYTDNKGYGFETATNLTTGTDNVSGTAAYKMQVKVPNGNYKVSLTTTSSTVLSEAVSDSTATGVSKSGSEFNVAVCDGILDLTFNADSTVSKLEIAQISTPTSGAKPAVYSIGDSTTKTTGHVPKEETYNANKTAQTEARAAGGDLFVDERTMNTWGTCVTEDMYKDTFSSYSNNGMAGRNAASYYREGRLETVLLAIAPGDYVTINMGINSDGSGENYEKLMEYYYVQGVIQRGGIPVILTHTPDGVGFDNSQSSYNETTGKFDVASRNNNDRILFLKSLATKYNLNLIDVGQWGEDYFNSLTLDDLDKANTQNAVNTTGYTAPTTVYELVRSWYPDHNHYTKELGDVLATYIMGELTKIATGEEVPSAGYTVTFKNGDTVVSTVTVAAGGTVAAADIPAVPTKEGYTGKWMVGDAEFTSATVINANTTVTADYTKESSSDFSVTFTGASETSSGVAISATVTGTGEAKYIAYVAEYDATTNVLTGVTKANISITDEATTATVPYTRKAAGSVLKAFVWDADMKPYLANTAVASVAE